MIEPPNAPARPSASTNFRFYPPYVRASNSWTAGSASRFAAGQGHRPRRPGGLVGALDGLGLAPGRTSRAAASVFDHGYHIFSIAMFFLGHVERVFAWIDKTMVMPEVFWDAPSYIMWKHREGQRYGFWETVGSPELVVHSKYYNNDEWVEITGSKGVIWVTRCSGEMLPCRPSSSIETAKCRTSTTWRRTGRPASSPPPTSSSTASWRDGSRR
jgi:hypothetical protein